MGAGTKETANKHKLTRSVSLSHFLAAAAWNGPCLFNPPWFAAHRLLGALQLVPVSDPAGWLQPLLKVTQAPAGFCPEVDSKLSHSYTTVPEGISRCLAATTDLPSQREPLEQCGQAVCALTS